MKILIAPDKFKGSLGAREVSEAVAAGLRDGTFGMAEETGREMNEAFVAGMAAGVGLAERGVSVTGRRMA